jgi:uncharacterized protein (TIGR00369 family)
MAKLLGRIQAMVRGEAQAPPIAKLFDMRITEASEGRATMQMPVDGRYANVSGSLHGGTMCEMADAAMGTAFATTLEEGEGYTTVELKCNYLRPVWDTMLTASAWVVSRGKTLGLTECELRSSDNKLIAKLSSTLMVLRGDKLKGRELK